ncbi:4-phosphopantetheinyl transferase [Bacillus cereus]|nr:4-phosphopantetheinyl transferase [Bacillus cereus]PFH95723.1 4-phosphopantetheinyl transferase [Bacillus cereus]
MKFQRLSDRYRCLIGKIMIRSTISKQLGLSFNELNFAYNDFGKPYLKNDQNVHFNLSHSGDFVVACIDKSKVGIDIEKIDNIPIDDITNIFYQNEINYIKNNDGNTTNLERFFRIWTLKESFLKYLGKGLSFGLKAIMFNIAESGAWHKIDYKVLKKIGHEKCHFNQMNLTNDYIVSVCREYESQEKLKEFYFNGE